MKSKQSIDQAVLSAICNKDKELLASLILPLSGNRIKNDWLKHAVELDQFDCFQALIEKKKIVRFEAVSPYNLYGKALRKKDTRYLASLMQHGAYESVTKNMDPDSTIARRTFFKASGQALHFLQVNGYSFGLLQGLETIVCEHSARKAEQISVIADDLFWKLDAQYLALAIEYLFSEGISERIDRLVVGRDSSALLSKVCDIGNIQVLDRLIEAGVKLAPVTAANLDSRAKACRQRVKETRTMLVELLQDIAGQ